MMCFFFFNESNMFQEEHFLTEDTSGSFFSYYQINFDVISLSKTIEKYLNFFMHQ